MSKEFGVRPAAQMAGTSTTTIYVEACKGNIRARVDPADGHLLFQADDLVRLRVSLEAKQKAAREAFEAAEDAKFREINKRRP